MKRKSAKPPLLTLDCIACFETYYFRTPGPHQCEDCHGPLLQRSEGAEPFEPESYVNDCGLRYCRDAEAEISRPSLFDLLAVEAAEVASD